VDHESKLAMFMKFVTTMMVTGRGKAQTMNKWIINQKTKCQYMNTEINNCTQNIF